MSGIFKCLSLVGHDTTYLENAWNIDAKELIGSKLLFLSPVRSRKSAYRLKTSLGIDSGIKR